MLLLADLCQLILDAVLILNLIQLFGVEGNQSLFNWGSNWLPLESSRDIRSSTFEISVISLHVDVGGTKNAKLDQVKLLSVFVLKGSHVVISSGLPVTISVHRLNIRVS